MRTFSALTLGAGLLAIGLLLMARGGTEPAQANPGNLDVHVHDDFFHPKGKFLVGGATDHSLAKAGCEKASPDAECDAAISVGDTLTWVAPAPLAVNTHSVTECTDNTFTTCGSTADPNNPIGDSGVRNPPPATGSDAWPYGPVQFNTAGTFYYKCLVHPDVMRGRIVVTAAVATATPTPSPTASPTPSPTATPAAAPVSGGSPGAGQDASPWWLLLAAGGGLLLATGATLALRSTRRP